VEDNAARAERRQIEGLPKGERAADIVVRVHRVTKSGVSTVAEARYTPGNAGSSSAVGGRATVALELIDELPPKRNALIVAGSEYGSSPSFLRGLRERGLIAIVEIRPGAHVLLDGRSSSIPIRDLLPPDRAWTTQMVRFVGAAAPVAYSVAALGGGSVREHHGSLFAAQKGGILGIHAGTVFALAIGTAPAPDEFLQAVGWTRWIRPLVRRSERPPSSNGSAKRQRTGSAPLRANITLARRQDQSRDAVLAGARSKRQLKGALASGPAPLNVVELFAGGGGMGLGFLLAGSRSSAQYRLVSSAEVHPIYVRTLNDNHARFQQRVHDADRRLPAEAHPLDLRLGSSRRRLYDQIEEAGGADVLIGGPPCQGFSNANRNSWNGSNPYNGLVRVFLDYVKDLQPKVFLLENVQGLHWTAATKRRSMLEQIERHARAAGYEVFVKLLDAVWYGVPQYRSRFFVLGLHRDLGYSADDFGQWGPFPTPSHGPGTKRPYATVRDAIADLPPLENGGSQSIDSYVAPAGANAFLREMRRGVPRRELADHVASRHADYVIERYRRIPPGGNWFDIRDHLTNYADVQRTHSNIYRRLVWDEPSITIGHYRKSMLVHPSQHRGLSLREACRLQSFPDWFRFAGTREGGNGGLVHKQQQLANAVCPLVTRAIADFILQL
jgi:DNA-cytosine methyltransferase